MLAEYKKKRGLIDCILFLKWDRFSRNAGDSYAELSRLQKLGIEAQAIEQPLDLSVPENKMMLAFYLAAPEVENARRALNVLTGMRRARKEGRYMGPAPLGYANKVTETGKKYIAPKEPQATIIRWVFSQLATGKCSVEQLWRESKTKGLKSSKNNFWRLVNNPLYCGKIEVHAYQDEEACTVQGQHEPLISEETFYQAQEALHSRKRKKKTVFTMVRPEFPLRNFLLCPQCGRTVTASSSKGRNAYYAYYHCTSSCGYRHKAETVNTTFVEELQKYKPHPAMVELYKQVIADVYNNHYAERKYEKKVLLHQINEQNDRLAKARELLLADTIDAADYKEIKTECERRLNLLEAKLATATPKQEKIEMLLDKALYNLLHLDTRYKNADIKAKRQIIGSIFPEKLVFEENAYRTARVNEAVQLIYSIDKAFREKKKGQTSDLTSLSHEVTRIGFEPMTASLEG